MKISATLFRDVCDDYDISSRTDYSGRGMYGRNCVGIVGDAGDLVRFLREVAPEVEAESLTAEEGRAVQAKIDDDETGHTYALMISDEWYAMSVDNMGRDMIYYWPGIQAVEPEDDSHPVDKKYDASDR